MNLLKLYYDALILLGLHRPPKAPAAKKAAKPSAGLGGYDYTMVGRGEPDIINLVPLELPSGLTVYVTPTPMYRMHNGVPTHIPMSAKEQSAYGKARKLLCMTDLVLDTLFKKGWYMRPQTDFYDPNGDMQSPDLVIKKGIIIHAAKQKAGIGPNAFSGNDSKGWILSNANKAAPTQGVNRGYWMTPTDTIPVQKRGIAHPWTYTDIAQDGWFMSEDTSQGDARDIMQDPSRFKLITSEDSPIWRVYYE